MPVKVAIVTGSNKGIGLAIVKGLCKRFDGVVYLTSRDVSRGIQAVKVLEKDGLKPQYHQLDVADKTSVTKFGEYIKNKYGGIDILINNAGVAPETLNNVYEDCKRVIDINYGGLLTVEEVLFPLLRDNARVVNVSSDCGHLSNVRNQEWINKLSNKNLTRSDINDFVNWFLESVKKNTFKNSDFADNGSIASYRVSKVAMSAATILQQKELESRGIIVNSMHPGLVSTDMTTGIGFYSIDDAAETPIYLALEASPTLKGAYIWYDKTVVDWFDHKADYYFKRKSILIQFIKNSFKNFFSLRFIGVGVLSIALIVAFTKTRIDKTR